ncbi:hypothetical protein SCHPADRAFT_905348 [Schizopora paradoxa]|uniref:Uncharacterized protein n=1 Tax=Schizopora paradoxa TaxID=27342 RepID=A0A0H2S5L6_9AGAM|nr:hypothetical protein SCHPADRAFT_905348 [Schizopora paradoxa]
MDNFSYAIFRTVRARVRIIVKKFQRRLKKSLNPKRVFEYQESALNKVFDPNAPTRRDSPAYVHTLHKRAPRNLFLYFTLFSFVVFFLDIILSGIIEKNVKSLAAKESKAIGSMKFEGGNSVSFDEFPGESIRLTGRKALMLAKRA